MKQLPIESKNKILNITLELLKQKSVDEISVREIASKANMNVASINYYYSSKEVLFNEALDLMMLSGIEKWIENNINYDKIQINDLHKFVYFLHLSIIQNPGIRKTRIINQLNTANHNQVNIMILDTFFKIAKEIYPNIESNLLNYSVSLLYGSLASISCNVSDFNSFLHMQLEKEDDLNQYVETIIKTIFN